MARFGQISQTKVASRVAKGPGSMFGRSEAYAAARAENWALAIELARLHNGAVAHKGPDVIHSFVITTWEQYQDGR